MFQKILTGNFLGQFKNEQKVPKMVYILPNFLVLHFGENFMKIQTKIPKLLVHENLHKNVNENMFFIHIFMENFTRGDKYVTALHC